MPDAHADRSRRRRRHAPRPSDGSGDQTGRRNDRKNRARNRDGRRTADRRPGMPEGRSENIQGNVPYRLAAACRPNMQPDPGTEPVSGRVERAEPSGRNTGRSQNLPCESRSGPAGKGPRSHRNGRQGGNQSSLRGRLCPNRGAADRRQPACIRSLIPSRNPPYEISSILRYFPRKRKRTGKKDGFSFFRRTAEPLRCFPRHFPTGFRPFRMVHCA